MIAGIIVLCVLLTVVTTRYYLLKREIRSLSHQIGAWLSDETEKMLDISLIDRDLESLAARLNRNLEKQRSAVAGALQHEEHLKESIASISHDLRTPLTVIMGHIQLLQNSKLAKEQKERLEIIQRRCWRMNGLIASFYELAVLDTEQLKPQYAVTTVSNLLAEYLIENAPLFEKKNIQPEVMFPDVSVFANVDPGMLGRIYQNLLGNAIQYSGGMLRVSLETLGNDKLLFRIENTIKEDKKIETERLFERFYIGDQSRQGDSTGLGLAVVKKLVEMMQGSVNASIKEGILTIIVII